MIREKEKEEEEGETYGLGWWVFPSRLVCFAPKLPQFGTLMAILRPAHFLPLYFCLRQSRAKPPTAGPTVNACQSTFSGLTVNKYLEEALGDWELKLYLSQVPSICS